jgi:hypothetical protein
VRTQREEAAARIDQYLEWVNATGYTGRCPLCNKPMTLVPLQENDSLHQHVFACRATNALMLAYTMAAVQGFKIEQSVALREPGADPGTYVIFRRIPD